MYVCKSIIIFIEMPKHLLRTMYWAYYYTIRRVSFIPRIVMKSAY